MSRRRFIILAAGAILAALTFGSCRQFFERMPHKKWGFIDKYGMLVIPAKFDDVARDEHGGRTLYHKAFRNFSEGLCAVRVGKKWGFIDKKGNFVIEPKYEGAGCFSEGLACVRAGAKYGYIDRTGKVTIPMEFDWPSQSSEVSSDNPDWDFSKKLIEPMVFSEGLAVVRKHDRCGYIDHTGKIAIEPTFLGAQPFDQGFDSVTTTAGLGLVDKTGKLKDPGSHCIGFAGGLFLAHSGLYTPDKRRLFYLNKNGQRAFPQDFADARVFSEGLAAVAPASGAVSTNTAYGYINTDGQMVIKPQFYIAGNNLAADFVDGRAIVSQLSLSLTGSFSNLHGVIDRSGQWVVRPKYDHISAYSDGLARALINNRWLFLDKNGHEAVQTQTAWANSYSDGLAAVMQ
jgi:hypothetical protein